MSPQDPASPRVLILCGEDPDLKQEAIERMRHQDPKSRSWDWQRVSGAHTELSAVLNDAGTPGLFSLKTVRVVEDADRYFKRGASQENVALLRRFSEQRSPEACMILVTSLKPKAAEALGIGRVIPCWPLEDREGRPELTRWTLEKARSFGKTLDSAAAAALLGRTGNALSRISDALGSLALYVGSRSTITVSDVESLVGTDPQAHAFALAEATALGQGPRALKLLRQRLEAGESAPGISAILIFHWRRLSQAIAIGGSPVSAAEAVGVRYPFQAPFVQALHRLSLKDAGEALRILRDADRSLKGGAGAGRAALERAVVRLCALGARARRA